ncbi:hypothetical protein EJB05_09153 [Eragrostis curvula]|uniref:Uncharacterized protein n=1 Tax=Eragrostis curvula TaxID=38414 RepID=A0A5J9W1X3_9POAL|nr:hypothetical protein EJB05_09153 [Eragrostis curvula]
MISADEWQHEDLGRFASSNCAITSSPSQCVTAMIKNPQPHGIANGMLGLKNAPASSNTHHILFCMHHHIPDLSYLVVLAVLFRGFRLL